jgi:hypothetical protein
MHQDQAQQRGALHRTSIRLMQFFQHRGVRI